MRRVFGHSARNARQDFRGIEKRGLNGGLPKKGTSPWVTLKHTKNTIADDSDESTSDTSEVESSDGENLKRKAYEKELKKLHVELVKLQEWVRHEGRKVCIIFEGRDGAGKGGVIKAITERVSPRIFRVIALPAPTEREKSQMYIQRYLPHLPAGGEIVIFDRSWYNRAGVERVMGFCTDEQVEGFSKSYPTSRGRS